MRKSRSGRPRVSLVEVLAAKSCPGMDGVRPLPSSKRMGITFSTMTNYGCETVFLPNYQISLWDKWQPGEIDLNRFFLAAGFN
jgi:hypothetical protein